MKRNVVSTLLFILGVSFVASSCSSNSGRSTSSTTCSCPSSFQSITEKVTVTFLAREGVLPTGSSISVTVDKGSCVELPVPTYEKHSFIGWYTGSGPNDRQFFSHEPVLEDLTLEARYSGINNVVLDKTTIFRTKDDGFVNEADVGGYTFNLVGHKDSVTSFGSLAQQTRGGKTFNGLIFNKSIISGLKSISVKYIGGTLYYIFSDYLLEDLTFTKSSLNRITSETEYIAPEGYRYFLLFTDSVVESEIDSISIKVDVDEVFVDDRVYGDTTKYAHNRSVAKSVEQKDDYFVIENDPTAITNNYSKGKTEPHVYSDSWYRWNGIDLEGSEIVQQNEFDYQITIMGNYEAMVDDSKYFNYSIWVELEFFNGEKMQTGGWVYAFIGNDNYEPLGHEDSHRINTDYNDTYAGRFFTCYDVSGNFADPDTNKTVQNVSYRDAFNSSPYPYWNVNFHISANNCTLSINGHTFKTCLIFDSTYLDVGEKVPTTEPLQVKRSMLTLVNYGDGGSTPAPSYKGTFTKPRYK